jgi:uncharacterized OB-fold protein
MAGAMSNAMNQSKNEAGVAANEVAAKVKCPKCGAANLANSKFCNDCGTRMESAPAACAKCGVQLQPGAKFCNECGTKVE